MNLTAGVAEMITKRIRQEVAAHGAYRAIVTAVLGSGMVQIKLPGTSTTGGEAFARVSGLKLIANDEVLVLPVRGVPVVIGLLQRSSPAALSFDEPLVFEKQNNSPLFDFWTQDTADDASCTSNSVWDTAMDSTLALGAGTWFVQAIGEVTLDNDSSGAVKLRVVIDGNTAYEVNEPSANTLRSYRAAYFESAVTGNRTITIELEYASNTNGQQTNAANPSIWAFAYRYA